MDAERAQKVAEFLLKQRVPTESPQFVQLLSDQHRMLGEALKDTTGMTAAEKDLLFDYYSALGKVVLVKALQGAAITQQFLDLAGEMK
jgi:hypothetical protein